MALQSSGQITLYDIAGEFGGAAPHTLQEYYGAAAGIPSSGTISILDFYGASAVTNINFKGDPGWNSAAALDIWTFDTTAGYKYPYRDANRVRLYSEVVGTYPSWTIDNNEMTTSGVDLQLDTTRTHRLTVEVLDEKYMNNFSALAIMKIYYTNQGSSTGLQLPDPGTYTIDFIPDGAITSIRIYTSHNTDNTFSAWIDIGDVFLELL